MLHKVRPCHGLPVDQEGMSPLSLVGIRRSCFHASASVRVEPSSLHCKSPSGRVLDQVPPVATCLFRSTCSTALSSKASLPQATLGGVETQAPPPLPPKKTRTFPTQCDVCELFSRHTGGTVSSALSAPVPSLAAPPPPPGGGGDIWGAKADSDGVTIVVCRWIRCDQPP